MDEVAMEGGQEDVEELQHVTGLISKEEMLRGPSRAIASAASDPPPSSISKGCQESQGVMRGGTWATSLTALTSQEQVLQAANATASLNGRARSGQFSGLGQPLLNLAISGTAEEPIRSSVSAATAFSTYTGPGVGVTVGVEQAARVANGRTSSRRERVQQDYHASTAKYVAPNGSQSSSGKGSSDNMGGLTFDVGPRDSFGSTVSAPRSIASGSFVQPPVLVRQRSFEGGVDYLCCGIPLKGMGTGNPMIDERLSKESLSKFRFWFGCVSVLLVAFSAGRWPENLWMVYCVKIWFYIPIWYYRIVTKRKGWLYILEPCWCINVLIGIYLLASAFRPNWGVEFRLACFQAFFVSSLGFLGWSIVVSRNVMIFNSLTSISAILIHLVPTMVCTTIRWQRLLDVPLQESWPGVFPTHEELEADKSVATLFVRGAIVYGVWWIGYSAWLLTVGITMPDRGLPTIYHNYRRKNLNVFKKLGGENMRLQAVAFMSVHLVLVLTATLWAALCYTSIHMCILWVLVLTFKPAWHASQYYQHGVFNKVFPKASMRSFPDLLW